MMTCLYSILVRNVLHGAISLNSKYVTCTLSHKLSFPGYTWPLFSILSVTLSHKLELPMGYTWPQFSVLGVTSGHKLHIRFTPHVAINFNSQYVTLGHNVHSPVTRRGHKVTFVLG